MAHPDIERLRSIKTFPSLVKYLRDELDWPIESDDVEDLTFEYEAEELGIDPRTAAKIQEIKQLRPMDTKQPWGIFFVKFEPKRLPVVVLRKILNQLVIKKRASAGKSTQAAWNLHDLLFISSYGEQDERQITFAHFTQDPAGKDLPTLKVLGWDGRDTALHVDEVVQTLKTNFRWPRTFNVDQVRERWSSAFEYRHREVINTASELAERLAALASRIRGRVLTVMAYETEKGPIRQLHAAFRAALVHDLEPEGFADMYAQTIAYGLLSARIADPTKTTLDDFAAHMRTNPFLRELMETFLRIGGRKGKAGGPGIDFDELGVSEVVALLDEANMEAVVRDFGDRNPTEDPVIHFYEHFLAAYDKQLKVSRGVFYTPQPVVSYIVRSVHELLQTEFGLEDGLADTTTWGEMLEKHPGLKLPPLTDEPGEKRTISPDEPFVQILDPATGTATFLVEVIEVIHQTLQTKWKKQRLTEIQQSAAWNEYVPKHLLPRLHGYELMMAPYAIAHMKIGLKLAETGYRFGTEERARIYLTNALEPWMAQRLLIGFDALAHEANAVNEIKQHKSFTVVIGNPPYSGISANMSEAMIDMVEPYKQINGVSLGERKIWAQDDYKKFIRFGQLKIAKVNYGILALITNNGFINEPTSRGMRHNLLATFPRISVIDLHGSLKKREVCPDGNPDRNVFDIEQGVAIILFRRGGSSKAGVDHADLWGLREAKYDYLLNNTERSTTWFTATPSPEFFLFVPQNEDTKIEFSHLINITEVFEAGSNGIQTSRDHVVYGFSQTECRNVIEDFRSTEVLLPTHKIREKYWPGKKVAGYTPGDTRGWRVPEARQKLRQDKNWEVRFRQALYRPFDFQTLFYADYMIDWPRTEVMSQMLVPNLSLCVGRAGSAADNYEWNIVFVANTLVDMNLFYRGGNVNYPLRFASPSGGLAFDLEPRPNFKPAFLNTLSKTLGLHQTKGSGLPSGLTPEDIISYVYAIFHSPGYRSRYAEFLKIDFPRLPLTANLELFHLLAKIGHELVVLHLMESPKLGELVTKFNGPRNAEVEKIGWTPDNGGTVYIDAKGTKQDTQPGTSGFQGVRQDVWNFRIGGYQVCEKWLKDRKGRVLSDDDIAHYQKIVVALSETIRLMAEIDEVIEAHGGWPGAFVTGE